MKEITLFTESEKKVMRPLLKAKEQGNHEAAIKYTEMWIEGHKRALAEYKKHPENEKIECEDDDSAGLFAAFYGTVKAQIKEIEEEIAECEAWLRENK